LSYKLPCIVWRVWNLSKFEILTDPDIEENGHLELIQVAIILSF
jgi:hypothetical protein